MKISLFKSFQLILDLGQVSHARDYLYMIWRLNHQKVISEICFSSYDQNVTICPSKIQ